MFLVASTFSLRSCTHDETFSVMRIGSGVAALILSMALSISVRDFSLEKRANVTEPIPAPIVVPPSGYFEGVDGLWSTFNIRVGTPPQSVRVIASTNSPDTLVVLPGGCKTEAIPKGVPTNCAFSRGGTFNNTLSTTWDNQGYYGLNGGNYGFEANLEYSINLQYGLDTLGLGYEESADAPTLKNQTVAGFALPNPLYLGMFGMGTQPQIYETFGNYSVPSFFKALRAQNLIPGLSWSYTAGAYYRYSAGQNAQLIFGGYDISRFQPNSVQFTLNADVTRDLVVGIQSILYSGVTMSTLLYSPIYAFIESTDPNIWLPSSACRLFEEAFGLVFDNATKLYLMNDTQYATLAAQNPSVTIRLANGISGGSAVDIVLPFNAFALKAAYPFVANSSYYFPLKQAANDTQYTLGRTFLQEAYLTVDYERGNFSISQCTWIQASSKTVISILSPSYANSNSNSSTANLDSSNRRKSKSTNGIKNSVVDALIGALVVALICAGIFYLLRRKKMKLIEEEKAAATATVIALTDLHSGDKDTKEFDPPSDGREIFQLPVEERPVEICTTFPDGSSETSYELDGESSMSREFLTPGRVGGQLRMPSPLGRGESVVSPGSVTSTARLVDEGLKRGRKPAQKRLKSREDSVIPSPVVDGPVTWF